MRNLFLALLAASLVACAGSAKHDTFDAINNELAQAAKANERPAAPEAVAAALLPPLQIQAPVATELLEERFNLAFNNVPAPQFFMSIVSGTRFNMLVHPEVRGTISANLKDVTVMEALEAVRDLYGYDFRVEGNRITVRPAGLQTQVFQVNYLTGSRRGTSELRVSSTSVADVNNNGMNGNNPYNNTGNFNQNQNNQGGSYSNSRDSSKVSTEQDSDFWRDLEKALESIVGGAGNGRSVVISPHSGVVVVRAMPDELRNVGKFLKATQLSVGRQVILEAKILEVQLNESYQSGINWAGFRTNRDSPASFGVLGPGALLSPLNAAGVPSAIGSASGGPIAVPGGSMLSPASSSGSLFGLALQTSNFAALISFLESQGNVHVLSSPRIATLNNQKAVLKIGTDEFFVTNVSTTTTTGTSTVTTPSVTLQPFFSGVVLDVTPQIDDAGNIILHVRPSVSQVETVNKSIDLGTGGSLRLPLAASNTSETDSIVRGRDGQVVAIGGLMRQASRDDRSGLPGASSAPGVGALFGSTNRLSQKRELVILLKPTIVQDDTSWTNDIMGSKDRIERLAPQAASPR